MSAPNRNVQALKGNLVPLVLAEEGAKQHAMEALLAAGPGVLKRFDEGRCDLLCLALGNLTTGDLSTLMTSQVLLKGCWN